MTVSRAVVLSDSPAGLRLSAWLARRGMAVRHLGLGPLPVATAWPTAVLGRAPDLDGWLGRTVPVTPHVGLVVRGELRPMPRRRRDLAGLVGGSVMALAADLRPHVRTPRTVGQWGTRNFGTRGWKRLLRAVTSKRLGLSSEGEPACVAGLLVTSEDARWRATTTGADQATVDQIEAVLDAGGEALQRVEVERIEVTDGRASAVMAEFGRELVDGPLYTDLAPAVIAALLPDDALPPGAAEALQALPVQERSVVTLDLDAERLPWEVWVADVHVPVVRFWRAWGGVAQPRADRVFVELETAPDRGRAESQALTAISPFAPVHAVVRVERVTMPLVTLDPRSARAMSHLRALGIVPVGGLANHLPLTLSQEASMAAAWAQGEDPGQTAGALLRVPETRRGVLP